jgi:hypothetical protein
MRLTTMRFPRGLLYFAVNFRRAAFASTSVGGSRVVFFSFVVIGKTSVALLSHLQAVDCRTFIGAEGSPAR